MTELIPFCVGQIDTESLPPWCGVVLLAAIVAIIVIVVAAIVKGVSE